MHVVGSEWMRRLWDERWKGWMLQCRSGGDTEHVAVVGVEDADMRGVEVSGGGKDCRHH